MKNYYYVISFNMTHPSVKSMMQRQSFLTGSEIIDLKIRSRPFLSFTEAMIAGHKDYSMKHEALYPGQADQHDIRHVSVINPDFMELEDTADMIRHFGDMAYQWTENCCSALFFASIDDEAQEVSFGEVKSPSVLSDTWMIKYEIMTCEDLIEMPGNGDFIFTGGAHERTLFH